MYYVAFVYVHVFIKKIIMYECRSCALLQMHNYPILPLVLYLMEPIDQVLNHPTLEAGYL